MELTAPLLLTEHNGCGFLLPRYPVVTVKAHCCPPLVTSSTASLFFLISSTSGGKNEIAKKFPLLDVVLMMRYIVTIITLAWSLELWSTSPLTSQGS